MGQWRYVDSIMNNNKSSVLKNYKNDVNDFISIINKKYVNSSSFDNNFTRNLTKKIICLKLVKSKIKNSGRYVFYIDKLISDIIFLIDSYYNSNERYINLNIRSIIESFCCLVLGVSQREKSLNMTEILKKISLYIKSLKDDNIRYDLLSNEYVNSCMHIHENIKVKDNLVANYDEVIHSSIHNPKKMCNRILKLSNLIVMILSYRFSSFLNDTLVRQHFILKYLLGDKSLSIIKNNSTVIILKIDYLNHKIIDNLILSGRKNSKINNYILRDENYNLKKDYSLEFEDEITLKKIYYISK